MILEKERREQKRSKKFFDQNKSTCGPVSAEPSGVRVTVSTRFLPSAVVDDFAGSLRLWRNTVECLKWQQQDSRTFDKASNPEIFITEFPGGEFLLIMIRYLDLKKHHEPQAFSHWNIYSCVTYLLSSCCKCLPLIRSSKFLRALSLENSYPGSYSQYLKSWCV